MSHQPSAISHQQNTQSQGSSIAPTSLQSALDASANALDKGQAQWFTPLEFGRQLARGLPQFRPVVTDLTCGLGHLLAAVSNETTTHVLGVDIDTRHLLADLWDPKEAAVRRDKITAEVCETSALLHEVGCQFDLMGLNPPFSLRFRRDRLAHLAQSHCLAVRDAFAADDGKGKDTIDSTPAVLMIALHHLSEVGEGFLIANEATLQRLIFAPNAPHGALVRHLWWHQVFPGNPMTGRDNCNFQHGTKEELNPEHLTLKTSDYSTGVIWFARSHESGPNPDPAKPPRRGERLGAEIREWDHTTDTVKKWEAVREETAVRQGRRKPQWNLWLEDGKVGTDLSAFQEHSAQVDRAAAARLHALAGQRPMQLVLQRAQRLQLMEAAGLAPGPSGRPPSWRVQPELIAAVQAALAEYETARAPLYPLNKIQRLGYLDEHDTIRCDKEFADGLFLPGKDYHLSSRTVTVKRWVEKPNLLGQMETLEMTGTELALFLQDETGVDRCFMDATCRQPDMEVAGKKALEFIDHTLEQLAAHFHIPNVPDLAALHPDTYQAAQQQLHQLERLIQQRNP